MNKQQELVSADTINGDEVKCKFVDYRLFLTQKISIAL